MQEREVTPAEAAAAIRTIVLWGRQQGPVLNPASPKMPQATQEKKG